MVHLSNYSSWVDISDNWKQGHKLLQFWYNVAILKWSLSFKALCLLMVNNTIDLGHLLTQWWQGMCLALWRFNTLRVRQNGCCFADDSFRCILLNENVSIAIKISLQFDPKGPINNIPALVQIMAWCRQAIIWTNDSLITDTYMHHLASMS